MPTSRALYPAQLFYPDRLDRSLRALASDVGRALDSDLYQAAQVAREELMACLSDRQPT